MNIVGLTDSKEHLFFYHSGASISLFLYKANDVLFLLTLHFMLTSLSALLHFH